jgi:hypothetical protein
MVTSLAALDLAPAQPVTVRSAATDDWSLVAGAEASVALGSAVTASVGYSGVFGDNLTEHAARATIGVRF